MSGTIEQLHAKVDAILAILQAGTAAPQGVTQQPLQSTVMAQPQMLAQPQAQPLAAGVALPGQQQPAQQFAAVSAEQITALITPHVGDPNLKAALQQQMAAMGIGALPDAQPHQYGELYARFQQVISQFQAAAAQQPQQQASII